jgi:hypothetical protein
MVRTRTTQIAQQYRVGQAVTRDGVDRVANLIRAFVDEQTPTSVPNHFRHERKPIQRALLVQGCEDLARAPYLDEVAVT